MAEAVIKLKSNTLTRNELDDLSKQFLPMVMNIARLFSRKDNEYVSAGYEGVAYALRTAAVKMYDDNLELWVKSCVYRYMRRYRVTSHLVCIPNSTLRDARARGEVLESMQRHDLVEQNSPVQRQGRLNELIDFVDQSASDGLDRIIIELRIEGFTDQEIADKIGKSNSDVHRRRKRMEDKFNALLKGKPCGPTSISSSY